jgi:uncharacterized protein YcgI (DUF1989 family)
MTVHYKQSGMLAGQVVDRKYVELDARRRQFRLVSHDLIPARSGKGFEVKEGQVFRVVDERARACHCTTACLRDLRHPLISQEKLDEPT